MIAITAIFDVKRWSDKETAYLKDNRYNPLAISNTFDEKSNALHRMTLSKPGGLSNKELKGLKHSQVFKGVARKMMKRTISDMMSKKIKQPKYIGPERRKSNIPRLKKVA